MNNSFSQFLVILILFALTRIFDLPRLFSPNDLGVDCTVVGLLHQVDSYVDYLWLCVVSTVLISFVLLLCLDVCL